LRSLHGQSYCPPGGAIQAPHDMGVTPTKRRDTMRLKLAIPFLLLAVLVIVVN